MSRSREKKANSSIDETHEETSTVEEMDKVAIPLIKEVTIMFSKSAVMATFVVVAVASAPLIGLASPTPEQMAEKIEGPPGESPEGWVASVKSAVSEKVASTGDRIVTFYHSAFNESEQMQSLQNQVAVLIKENDSLRKQKDAMVVGAALDHQGAVSCVNRISEYLGELKIPKGGVYGRE